MDWVAERWRGGEKHPPLDLVVALERGGEKGREEEGFFLRVEVSEVTWR